MLDYAIILTSEPASMTEKHVDGLRQVGLSDRAIHDAASIAAYFNFVNRIALGLGVELEAQAE